MGHENDVLTISTTRAESKARRSAEDSEQNGWSTCLSTERRRRDNNVVYYHGVRKHHCSLGAIPMSENVVLRDSVRDWCTAFSSSEHLEVEWALA
jgi:hypothetical protein